MRLSIRLMLSSLVLYGGTLLLVCGHALSAVAETDQHAVGLELFESKIRPVLVKHCYECHSADAVMLKGSLFLDTRAGMLEGGDSGPAVEPGEPDDSLIVSALRHEDFEMPPEEQLSDAVVADFVRWIELGAPDPRDGEVPIATGEINIEAGRKFWAFTPPITTTPPDVVQTDWPRNDLDHFTLARMDAAGVMPVGDAERTTLLRRLYFDLVGLPPSPQEIDLFLADTSDDAYENVVDRLLASPHFGERWGRHWLDLARYAESTGRARNYPFSHAWRYRDYVIGALNSDMPFNQFITEQIAGDLLPHDTLAERDAQRTATGFLALGAHELNNNNNRSFKMDVVDEQIRVTSRAFLGLTVGCARCHDHKFDPIPTADYYALAGIFRSTVALSGFKNKGPGGKQSYVVAEMLYEIKDKRRPKTETAEPPRQLAAVSDAEQGSDAEAEVNEAAAGLQNDSDGVVATTKDTAAPAANDETAKPNKQKNKPNKKKAQGKKRNKNANQKKNPNKNKKKNRNRKLSPAAKQRAIERKALTKEVAMLENRVGDLREELRIVRKNEELKPGRRKVLAREIRGTLNQAITDRDKRRIDLTEFLGKITGPRAMGAADAPRIADCPIHIRGDFKNLGEKVPRGFLQVATGGDAPHISPGESGRRQLAAWIASEDNPLTARVAVNRVWHHLFGHGLVRTVDNFGAVGERPSHPELLDYLAVRFVEEGWSTKRLIREIVTSRTYRLASTHDEANFTIDPDNRLLWRAHRRRLEVEALRDAMLAASGTLDRQPLAGSAAARIPVKQISRNDPVIRKELQESTHRTVYLPVVRNFLPDLYTTFDYPEPSEARGRREVTTVAPQALYLMNSPLVIKQSRLAARNLRKANLHSDTARLRQVFLQTLGRLPTAAQQERLLSFVEQTIAEQTKNETKRNRAVDTAWATVYQSLFATAEFRYLE